MANELEDIEKKIVSFFKKEEVLKKEYLFKHEDYQIIIDLLIESKNTIAIEFKNLAGLDHLPSSYLLNFLGNVMYLKKRHKKVDFFYFITNAKIPYKFADILKKENIIALSTKDKTNDEICNLIFSSATN